MFNDQVIPAPRWSVNEGKRVPVFGVEREKERVMLNGQVMPPKQQTCVNGKAIMGWRTMEQGRKHEIELDKISFDWFCCHDLTPYTSYT